MLWLSKKFRHTITGHLPQKLPLVCLLFSKRGDAITKRAGGVAIIRELNRTGVHVADHNKYSLLGIIRC